MVGEMYFEKMVTDAKSEKEREFFQTMRFRHANNFILTDDRLVEDTENTDHIYLYRLIENEFEVGQMLPDGEHKEQHVMDIKEAMELNLMDLGYIDRNLTVLEWLRENDFAMVNYERVE